MNLPGTPKNAEDKRLRGGSITERAANPEEARLRPDLAIATPLERARDVEEKQRPGGH